MTHKVVAERISDPSSVGSTGGRRCSHRVSEQKQRVQSALLDVSAEHGSRFSHAFEEEGAHNALVSSILKDIPWSHKASSSLLCLASLFNHRCLHAMNSDDVVCSLPGFFLLLLAVSHCPLAVFPPAAFPLLRCLMSICNPCVRVTRARVTFELQDNGNQQKFV